jgi:hypothetical protein
MSSESILAEVGASNAAGDICFENVVVRDVAFRDA